MCTWAQRQQCCIHLLHVHYNNLRRKSSIISPLRNKGGDSACLEVDLFLQKVNLRQHEQSWKWNKEGKGEKSYCFNHTKPFHRLVVESPRVLGASFFTLNTAVDAWCCVFSPPTPLPTFLFFFKLVVIIRRNSKPPPKVSRLGELWGQGWRQIS